MQVRLLGPVDVVVEGEPRPVRGLRRKAALAALALHGGEIVSTGRLVDVVWDEAAPPTAVNTLQSHMSYLRSVLGSKAAIVARPPGYLLELGEDGTDVLLAERLLREGTQSADPVLGVRHLRGALALWRGRPLADVAGLAWLEEQAGQLDLLCVQVKRALFEARLASGEHAQLVPDLERMAAGHPLDEHIHSQLMLALYRSGRQADALAVYHRLRRTLDEELGLGPAQALRDLETAILRQDRALDAPTLAVAPPLAPPAVPVPAQLPPAVPAFAGRGAELARLGAIVPAAAQADSAPPAAVVISAVSGTAGVGKTALAVHWAHRVASRFPDGQLYVNLRGFDPSGAALDPAEALRGFLDAFGIPAERIPGTVAAQAALYRSLLAGKRVLVVLDNARDAAHVRPLLPGSPGCLVIVTSRDQLTPLVATEGAHHLALGLLAPAEARDLLAHRLGASRVAAEPGAVDDIITRCARLPLALAIAAARAATHPGLPLTALAAELHAANDGLRALSAGDPAADVRAVFSWSCHALTDAAAGLFRLLGLHPGPDLTLAAAASLAGLPPDQAQEPLAELVRASLLSELAPGRYGCHDLLRVFGAELARSVDTGAARRAAHRRVLDHYLHSAHAAALLLGPLMDTVVLSAPADRVTPESPAGHDAARAWFAAEQDVLLAAVDQAAAAGFDAHTWQLAWTMDTFLKWRGRWRDQAGMLRTAVAAARRLHDPVALATMLRALARACSTLGLWNEASTCGEEALALFTEIGDLNLQAFTHLQLGSVDDRRGRPAQAIRHAREALGLYQQTGNHPGQAQALNSLGWAHTCLGEHQQALTFCLRALPWLQDAGDRDSEAGTWDSIGCAHHHLGHYQQAVTSYQTALELARTIGDSYLQAEVLTHLGDTLLLTAGRGAAHRVMREALAILDRLGHPDAAGVRAKLAQAPAAFQPA
jgi:DNA-binding SARP family transcriptional activator/tetratricopeptide (TPR) repeat protein